MKQAFYVIAILMSLCSQGVIANGTIRIATTTSTENSGLLADILPHYEKQTGNSVHVIAVGTGKALELGRRGDVDVILVHARKSEMAFVEEGYGVERYAVMYNDFVIVGPQADPAKIKGSESAQSAFNKITSQRPIYISRGDNSGTHKKELSLWKLTGALPKGRWYREVGQGMGKTLQIADELQAYTLVDRGTWLVYEQKVSLRVLYDGDKLLFNPYGVIAVSAAKHPSINQQGAASFIKWLTSNATQTRIANYKIAGKQLFHPSAK